VSGCGRWSRDVDDDDADACDASLNPDHSELFQGPAHVMFVNSESQPCLSYSKSRIQVRSVRECFYCRYSLHYISIVS
jgi:hypothetical protein